MANRNKDKQTQPQPITDGEFSFNWSLWKGIGVTAKGMDVDTYKSMLSATIGLRSPLVWLLMLMIFLMMLLAVFRSELTELFGSG